MSRDGRRQKLADVQLGAFREWIRQQVAPLVRDGTIRSDGSVVNAIVNLLLESYMRGATDTVSQFRESSRSTRREAE